MPQDGRWDIFADAAAVKGLSSRLEENLLIFLELQQGSSRVTMETSETSSWGLREAHSTSKSRVAPQDTSAVSAGEGSISGVEAGTSGFLFRVDMDLRVLLGHPQGSQGLVLCGAMQVCSSLKMEKQCQASCRADHRDWWLSLEALQGCHTCHHILCRSSG